MAYVITRLCRDCKDLGCVRVCPTDCILEHRPTSSVSDLPNQVFIDPDDCIDCNLCVPECPWEAIYPDIDVPDIFKPDVALNALVRERRAEFRVAEPTENEQPSSEEVAENMRRWGLLAKT